MKQRGKKGESCRNFATKPNSILVIANSAPTPNRLLDKIRQALAFAQHFFGCLAQGGGNPQGRNRSCFHGAPLLFDCVAIAMHSAASPVVLQERRPRTDGVRLAAGGQSAGNGLPATHRIGAVARRAGMHSGKCLPQRVTRYCGRRCPVCRLRALARRA